MQVKVTAQTANIVVVVGLFIAAVYFAAPFLIPLVLAGLLAMLLVNVSVRLERMGMGRGWASFFPLILFVGVVILLGFVLSWQIGRLAEDFSDTRAQITARRESLREWINDTIGIAPEEQKKMLEEQEKDASSRAGSMLFMHISLFFTGPI